MDAAYLLVSQSILSAAIHDLAGWAPAGKSLYHALGRDALEKEGSPCFEEEHNGTEKDTPISPLELILEQISA